MAQAGWNPLDNRNQRLVLNLIREHSALSRREVAAASSLSLSTAKRLIEELLSEKLVEEIPAEGRPKVRGPKAGNLKLRGGFGYCLGLNIEPERIELCAVSFSGEILKLESQRLQDRGSEGTIRRLAEIARAGRAALEGSGGGRLLGIGVAIAGLVDARRGFVYDCFPIPGWENVPLQERLEAQLGVPVLVDDRVRSMAVAEKRYGVARGLDTFLYIDVGNGVGSCFFLDNRIYRGKNGISGEFGHIPVKENGPQCNCGNKGCLEVLVSTGSLLAAVKSSLESNVYTQLKGDREITLAEVARAAGQGDKLASLLVFEASELIGIGLADLVSVFDPGTIILAGEVVRGLGPLLADGIVRTVRLRGIHPITQRTQFLNGSDIPHLGAWGAATLPLERWFGSGILNL
jgi:predicted NBD/HSP70 family sugar kinase